MEPDETGYTVIANTRETLYEHDAFKTLRNDVCGNSKQK